MRATARKGRPNQQERRGRAQRPAGPSTAGPVGLDVIEIQVQANSSSNDNASVKAVCPSDHATRGTGHDHGRLGIGGSLTGMLVAHDVGASGRSILGHDASRVLTAKLPACARSLKNPDKVQDQQQEHGHQQVLRNSTRSRRMGENYYKTSQGKDYTKRNVGQ
jgi:hypothetical protein